VNAQRKRRAIRDVLFRKAIQCFQTHRPLYTCPRELLRQTVSAGEVAGPHLEALEPCVLIQRRVLGRPESRVDLNGIVANITEKRLEARVRESLIIQNGQGTWIRTKFIDNLVSILPIVILLVAEGKNDVSVIVRDFRQR